MSRSSDGDDSAGGGEEVAIFGFLDGILLVGLLLVVLLLVVRYLRKKRENTKLKDFRIDPR